MALIHDLCDALARDVVAAMDELGDDRMGDKISQLLLDISPTTQEIFNSALRGLLAERRARAFLEASLKAKREGRAVPNLHMGLGN